MRKAAKLPIIEADWLLARVRDDGDGHLIWTGYSQRGDPKCNFGRASGDTPINLRRAIWKTMHDGREPRSDRIYVAVCGVYNCVEPAHIEARERGYSMIGRPVSLMQKVRNAKAHRAKSNLTPEDIADILTGELTQQQYADKYGITQSMVSLIQLRKAWKTYSLGGVFAGLLT